MRKILLKSLLAAVCLLVAFGASAQSVKFKDDKSGLYFETVLNDATGKYDQVWVAIENSENLWSFEGELVIPDEVTYNDTTYPVVGIATLSFNNQNITSLVIGRNVVQIGSGAFAHNKKLVEVKLPESLKLIGESVFRGCELLESVDLPEDLTEIGADAFSDCNAIESIDLPDGLETIGSGAFSGSGLKSVTIPAGLINGMEAFVGCENLTSVTFPDGFKEIPYHFFGGCSSLKSVIIPETVTMIGISAFSDTGIKDITIPENVEVVAESAFKNCKELESVKWHTDYEPDYGFGSVFGGCGKLKSIVVSENNPALKVVDGAVLSKDGTRFLFYPAGLDNEEYSIPEGIVSMKSSVFTYRYNRELIPLRKLHFPRSFSSINCYALRSLEDSEKSLITEISVANPIPPAITEVTEDNEGRLFFFAYASATLYVPVGSSDAYKKAEGWKYFAKIEEKEFSGVADIETSGITVAAQGGNIVVSGADNAEVAVYGIDGRVVYKGTDSIISVSSNGIYIVVVAGTIFKIIL